MRKRLYHISRSFLIISLQILFGGKDLYCRVTPIMDPDPQKSVRPRPHEWKYTDDRSESIRKYDRDNNKWHSVKQAILSCQKRVLVNYESKVDSLSQETGGRASKMFAKLKALEDAKDHGFIACSQAFQKLPVSERKLVQEKTGWKNNDDISREIRRYDGLRNKWINEEAAISRCKRQAKSNYELRRERYHVQDNYQEYQKLKDWVERSFKTCEKAFER